LYRSGAPEEIRSRYPRLADFAHWMAACETAEWPAGTFASAYKRNRAAVVEVSVEADAVATAVIDFIKSRGKWTGSAKSLLAELDGIVEEATKKERSWPRSPERMAGRLRRASGILRSSGIEVVPPGKDDRPRNWTIATVGTVGLSETQEKPGNLKEMDSDSPAVSVQPSQPPTVGPTVGHNSLKNQAFDSPDGCDGFSPSPPREAVCTYCGLPADEQPLRVAGDETRTALLHRRCEVAWLHRAPQEGAQAGAGAAGR
jgi:hypothetical protein